MRRKTVNLQEIEARLRREAQKGEAETPQAEVLGEYKPKPPLINIANIPTPEGGTAQIEVREPNPLLDAFRGSGDWRSFIRLRPGSELRRFRWKNPRQIDVDGWKGWMPVDAKDGQVEVINKLSVYGTMIRRGGEQGDILCYVPERWAKEYEQAVVERSNRQIRRAKEAQKEFIEKHQEGRYVSGASGKWETEFGG